MKAVLIVSLAIFALGSCMSPPDLKPKCGCPPSDEKTCGRLPDGSHKLFEGKCRAGCAGATVVKDINCYGTGLVPPVPHHIRICGCAPIKDPVCAKRADGTLADFSNHCSAGCADATIVHSGRCESHDSEPAPHIRLCGCQPIDEPVCTIIPGGNPKTYPNKCEASCHDAAIMHSGSCESHDSEPASHFRLCGCQPVDEPVCTIIPGGNPTTYPNKCEASCHDAVVTHEGECE